MNKVQSPLLNVHEDVAVNSTSWICYVLTALQLEGRQNALATLNNLLLQFTAAPPVGAGLSLTLDFSGLQTNLYIKIKLIVNTGSGTCHEINYIGGHSSSKGTCYEHKGSVACRLVTKSADVEFQAEKNEAVRPIQPSAWINTSRNLHKFEFEKDCIAVRCTRIAVRCTRSGKLGARPLPHTTAKNVINI